MNRHSDHLASTLKLKGLSGFSIIELLVTISIGVFITLGLSQIFVSMWSTSSTQSTLAQFQDNERMAIVMISKMVQKSGYFPNPAAMNAAIALPSSTVSTDGAIFTAGTGITGTTGAVNDTLDLEFMSSGNDGLLNCQGGKASVPTIFINSFSINASNQLVCSVSGNTPFTVATNVSSMKVLFGVDSQGLGTTDSYLTAAAVQASNLWPKVRMIAITLSFSNPLYPAEAPISWVQFINLMRTS